MRRVSFFQLIIHSQFAFFLLLVLASAAQGQTPSGTESASSSAVTTEKVARDIDEVPIDLIVHGKKKSLVNLTPKDFAVTDNGAAVSLKDLRFVTRHSGANHLVTFLFGALDPSSATNAREVARKILKIIPAQEFSFAVFNVDRRLRILQGFTQNREDIQKAVNAGTSEAEGTSFEQIAVAAEKKLIADVRAAAGQSQSPSTAYDRSVEQAMLASLTETQRVLQNQNMQVSLAGLLGLARGETRIPGRKLIIYFPEGAGQEADPDVLRSIAAAANRAEVSIFVINKEALDTRVMDGLMAAAALGNAVNLGRSASMMQALPTLQQAMQGNAQPFGPGMMAQVDIQNARFEGEGLAGNKDPFTAMADSTGGAIIFSEDNLRKPFQQAVADLTTYYEASYLPKDVVYDGKFHQIRVKPLKTGLKVRSRAGYFALPPAGGVRAFEVPILKVLAEAQLPTDVKFHTTVLQLGNLSTGNENTLVVEVPISGLQVKRDFNTNLISWHVSIVSEVKDKSGAVLEHFSEDVPGHGAIDGQAEAMCATMQRHFALPPGQYSVETAVLDQSSGKFGGERQQLDVANAAAGPFVSDVALVRRIDSADDELDALEPLRYQHGKVVPNISSQVVPGTKETSFFFLVRPDSGISDAAMLEMQVFRNGELMGEVPLQLPNQLTEAFPYVAALKTSSMPAGKYDVRISLTQGERVMEREGSFSIPGPALANAATGKPETSEKSQDDVADLAPAGEITVTKRQPLVITALPTDAVTRPSEQELDDIITGARKQATNYSAKLPNFVCVEITDRSIDPSGNGRWRRKDSFGELLRYVDKHETRKTLEVNGSPSSETRQDISGPISLGEFGHLLNLVFQPSSKAELHWKETDALNSGRVQVFEYRVDRKNDSMTLGDSNTKVYSSFHGLAYIDSDTLGVRRITMEAEDLPADFSIHATSIAVDYDYVTIGAHDYLMPIRATIRVKRGKRESDLNQIVFQDYRRFAAQSKVVYTPK